MPQRWRTPTLLLQLAMLLQKAMMRRRPLQLELPTTMQRVVVKGARVGMCTSTLMALCRTSVSPPYESLSPHVTGGRVLFPARQG